MAVVLIAVSRADDSDWLARNWQIENGLPDSCVTAITQSADGFLWVGTARGLARFDGLEFKVFRPESVPALGKGRITALLEDRKGVLWIATNEGSLLCYEDGRFNRIGIEGAQPGDRQDQMPERQPSPPAGNNHATLLEDESGGIWLWSRQGGLLSCRNGKVVQHSEDSGLPLDKMQSMAVGQNGRVWVLADDALYSWNEGKWLKAEGSTVPNDESPFLLVPARGGGLWMATRSGSEVDGARLIRRFVNGRWEQQLEAAPRMPNSFRSGVNAMLGDRAGRVWLGMTWNGVWVMEAGKGWKHLPGEAGLTECFINCLFEDREGAVWVGTDCDGLHCIRQRPVSVLKLPAPANENMITTSFATRDGALWIGTDGAGAFRHMKDTIEPFGREQGLDGLHICSILEDSGGVLWLGTIDGLYQFAGGRFNKVRGPRELETSILALYEDRSGRLWAGSRGGLVSRDSGRWSSRKLRDEPGGLDIRALAEDSAGNLWVGTVGQGLFRLEGSRVTRFMNDGGFPSQDARALYADPSGKSLWIGTLGQGLVRYQDGRFNAYSIADGFPSDSINSIGADGKGNLWMGSYNGIFSCRLESLEKYQRQSSPPLLVTHLSLAEGLSSRSCSGGGQPVSCQTADGRLWFPNFRGLVGFDPREVGVGEAVPQVKMESVVIDGSASSDGSMKNLRAHSDARRFEFHFTAPELVVPQMLKFRYRLDGMDEDWVNAGNQRSATYSQLPPGDYRFHVMVGGVDGQWHETGAPVGLTIVPRFWELGWVRLSGGAALMAGITGAFLLNQRRKHRRRMERIKQARALEQERQRIAANIHDDLGANLTSITVLSVLARERAIAGGIGPEMKKIHDTSRSLTRSMEEVVWAITPEHDSLDSLVTYLGKIAQDLLSAAGIRCRLGFPATLPDLDLRGRVRHNLFLAAKEALHNVVKHAAANEARLQVFIQPEAIVLTVADDGRGLGSATNGDALGRHLPGRGLGNMAKRMGEIGGTCEVFNGAEAGTTVRLVVPLNRESLHPQN